VTLAENASSRAQPSDVIAPESAADWPIRLRSALVLIGLAAAFGGLTAECVRYLCLGAYLDHIEGNIIISSWEYARGDPLYAFESGMPRFATFYGPLAYLAPLAALLLGGAGIAMSKFASLAALLGTVALMGWHWRRARRTGRSAHAMFFLLAALLLFSPMSFWVRPDPLETLLVAAGVACAASTLLLGICIGLAVNLKAHAFIYFLPMLVELAWTAGWRSMMRTGCCAGIVFALPFFAPGISMHDYLAGIAQQVGDRGQSASQLVPVLVYAAVLSLPVALGLPSPGRASRDRAYAAAALCALALLFYPATFSGAGAYHFLPLVPVLAEARHRLRPEGLGVEFAPFLILFFAALATEHTLRTMQDRQGWAEVADEALGLAQAQTGPVQIGYGDNRRSYEVGQLARTKLALNGQAPVIDAQILMELRQIGIDGSRRWVPELVQCQIARWLLPTGEEPFATRSYFYDGAPLFGPEFRRAFFEHYRLAETGAHFSIWECRDGRA